jgi:hypothetical protein
VNYGPLKLKLTGQKTYCHHCEQYFNSVYAFDKHRVGKHVPISEPAQRLCLSEAQLRSGGWNKKGGFWLTPKRAPVALHTRQGKAISERKGGRGPRRA